MKREDIKHIIEAVMFAYGEPISIKELNSIINDELSPKEIEYMLHSLKEEYRENNRGIQIIKLESKYQMCTNKQYADYIKKVLEPKKKKTLSQATLETLTIIAYKQPITKVEIEDISIDAIKMILPHILKVKTSEETDSKDDRLNKIVKGRIVSVEEKMVYIRDIIKEKEQVHFTNIIEDCDKNEVIATFLSILELIKAKEITVEQDIFFDDILIKRSSE